VVGTEDEAASFVAARRRELARFGFMLTGDCAAGEDLVQEALIRCLPAWSCLDPPGVEAYVRKVMARLAWKARRQPVNRHPFDHRPSSGGGHRGVLGRADRSASSSICRT